MIAELCRNCGGSTFVTSGFHSYAIIENKCPLDWSNLQGDHCTPSQSWLAPDFSHWQAAKFVWYHPDPCGSQPELYQQVPKHNTNQLQSLKIWNGTEIVNNKDWVLKWIELNSTKRRNKHKRKADFLLWI